MRLLKNHWRSLVVACIPLFFIIRQSPLVFSWAWEHGQVFPSIPAMVVRSDYDSMKDGAPWLMPTMNAFAKTPPDQNFYFRPNFDEGEKFAPSWWAFCTGLRYLIYPKLVFSHEPGIYNNSRDAYRTLFIGDKKTYDDLDWIQKKNVKFILFMRKADLSAEKSDAPISL